MANTKTGIQDQYIGTQFVELDKCVTKTLCTDDYLKLQANLLRKSLEEDRKSSTKKILKTTIGKSITQKAWFQRIYFPKYKIHTTSHMIDKTTQNPGKLNTLNNILDYNEGLVLRPLPKWSYLKLVLPSLKGLSVLEVGCASGFFSFKFAEMGARKVLGIDLIQSLLDGANFARDLLGAEKVSFRLANVLVDRDIELHDIVFMSEVYPHFIAPFQGLLNCINLSKKFFIIDANISTKPEASMRLYVAQNTQTGHIAYSSWAIPEYLLLDFLYLVGIEPHRITRYVSPIPNHMVYVIDTSDMQRVRCSPGRYHKGMKPMISNESFINS